MVTDGILFLNAPDLLHIRLNSSVSIYFREGGGGVIEGRIPKSLGKIGNFGGKYQKSYVKLWYHRFHIKLGMKHLKIAKKIEQLVSDIYEKKKSQKYIFGQNYLFAIVFDYLDS